MIATATTCWGECLRRWPEPSFCPVLAIFTRSTAVRWFPVETLSSLSLVEVDPGRLETRFIRAAMLPGGRPELAPRPCPSRRSTVVGVR